jgi:hypothetical protein
VHGSSQKYRLPQLETALGQININLPGRPPGSPLSSRSQVPTCTRGSRTTPHDSMYSDSNCLWSVVQVGRYILSHGRFETSSNAWRLACRLFGSSNLVHADSPRLFMQKLFKHPLARHFVFMANLIARVSFAMWFYSSRMFRMNFHLFFRGDKNKDSPSWSCLVEQRGRNMVLRFVKP